jgi:HAD superfamily hydrolase (TIGR01509 family)
MTVRAVLFDIDGTLVDSTYFHALAWSQALRSQGHDVPMATVHRAVGIGGDQILDHLVPRRDRSRDDALREAHAKRYERYWPDLRAFDGACELLTECHDSGVRVALTSSADERDLEVLLDVLDCEGAVDVVIGAKDVEASKPEPDVVEVALERLGVAPSEAVLVGDSVWDALAARHAGVRCIGVACGGTSTAELLDAGMVAVHSGPRDLLEHLRHDPREQPAGPSEAPPGWPAGTRDVLPATGRSR